MMLGLSYIFQTNSIIFLRAKLAILYITILRNLSLEIPVISKITFRFLLSYCAIPVSLFKDMII